MTVQFQIEGQRELFNRMNALEDKIEKRIGKKAIRAGGSEYAKLVKKEIPVDKSDDIHLKKSIKIIGAKGKRIAVQVGIKGMARAYAHVFEFGSRFVQGKRVFTRTLETNTSAIMDRVARVMKIELDKL